MTETLSFLKTTFLSTHSYMNVLITMSAVELAQDLRSSRPPEIYHKPHGLDEEEFPN